MSQTLVLGTAISYSEAQMATFLRSLRAAGYRGDIALLVDRRDVGNFAGSELLRDVQLVGVSSWLPFRFASLKKKPEGDTAAWKWLQAALWLVMRALNVLPLPQALRWKFQIPLGSLLYPPSESRFLHYWRIVAGSRCEQVLISDVRDVLFQTDPFGELPRDGLAVSLELPYYTIASERWNRTATQLIYGDAMLQRIGDSQVSCSGVTAGDRASMERYLELMSREIFGLGRAAARVGWFDQAIHNVVLRARWSGTLHGLGTLTSPIATLGAVKDADVKYDAQGRLLNTDGTPISIVHQYDRKPAVRDALLRAPAAESA